MIFIRSVLIWLSINRLASKDQRGIMYLTIAEAIAEYISNCKMYKTLGNGFETLFGMACSASFSSCYFLFLEFHLALETAQSAVQPTPFP